MNEIITPWEFFLNLEKEMNLFLLQHNGVSYWQLVRGLLLRKISNNNICVVDSKMNRCIRREIIGAYKNSKKIKRNIKNIKKVDLIRIRPTVSLSSDGKLDDHQYDYMDLSKSLKIIDLYALADYSEVSDCVEYSMSPIEFKLILWKIKRKILGERKIDVQQKKILKEFLEKINAEYKIDISMNYLEKEIQYAVKSHRLYLQYYYKIFNRTLPKIVLVYPHYDEHMFSAVAAAKKLGIKTIEVQHGRINIHDAYWYKEKSEKGKILPDYFFVYGEWWVKYISMPKIVNICISGNTYLDYQMRKLPTVKKEKRIISVFSGLQTGVALSNFICRCVDMLDNKNIEIWYKLHPNEFKIWQEAYPVLAEQSKIKIFTNEKSIYEIINCSDFILGINSTVIFEAVAFKNKKIFVLDAEGVESVGPLLESGVVHKFKTINELKKLIDNEKIENGSDCLHLWKENAIQETQHLINTIIGEEYYE